MPITDRIVPYELLFRFDDLGALAGAHYQDRRIVSSDGEILVDQVRPATPVAVVADNPGLPLADLLGEVLTAALVRIDAETAAAGAADARADAAEAALAVAHTEISTLQAVLISAQEEIARLEAAARAASVAVSVAPGEETPPAADSPQGEEAVI